MTRDPAMGEPRKRLTRMRYDDGPMGFLSGQIVKEMQRAGYPARLETLYRSPEDQERMARSALTTGGRFQSAHQYYGAADIVHERWAWFTSDEAPPGDQFWERVWDCTEVVSEKFGVAFRPRDDRHVWHIELANWREMQAVCGYEKPNQQQLEWYFRVTLPAVWKQHERSQARAA